MIVAVFIKAAHTVTKDEDVISRRWFVSQRIESLSEPAAEDKHVSTVSLKFPDIDMDPTITVIKEYYSQLAKSLQVPNTVKVCLSLIVLITKTVAILYIIAILHIIT